MLFAHHHLRGLALGVLAALAVGLVGCSSPAAAPTSAPAQPPTVAAKPAAATSPSAAAGPSPSAGTSPSASPAPAVAAPAPAAATLHITAPTPGQTVAAGSVQVSVTYSGPPLVAAASATKLDDYHLHYFLDENATPYLGTLVPVPMGNPHIVHTAATQVTFDNVAAGSHTVAVMLSGSNHISVTPPVVDQVTFTVG